MDTETETGDRKANPNCVNRATCRGSKADKLSRQPCVRVGSLTGHPHIGPSYGDRRKVAVGTRSLYSDGGSELKLRHNF